MIWLTLLTACANLIPLFESDRDWAMEAAPPPGRGWEPEAVLRISAGTLQELVSAAVTQELTRERKKRIEGPLGLSATLTPTAALSDLRLTPAPEICAGCLAVQLSGDGEMDWSASGLSGSVPFELSARGVLEISSDGFSVSAGLRSVERASVQIAALRRLKLDPGESVEAWARETLAERLAPIPLGDLSGEDLPLRSLRVFAETGGIRVELLTDAAHGGVVDATGSAPSSGWSVALSQETLLDLARRAAYEQGSVGDDVWVIPTGLRFDGERFALSLRIWRLKGRGWWRDYQVTGATEVNARGALKFKPEEAEELASSRGAGWVDPLAALGRGRILDAIEEGAAQAFPLKQTSTLGGLTVKLSPTRATGRGDALLVTGDLTLE